MSEKCPSPNAPIIWILSGLACFCAGILLLCCGWFFRVWEPEKTVSVRIYNTNVTNPDLSSLVNLEMDENVDHEFWVLDTSKPAQLGFLFNGRYQRLRFEQKQVLSGSELKAYYKRSEEGTEHVGRANWLSVNVNEKGEVLSPFLNTVVQVTTKPSNADFLRKVQ